MRYNAIQTVECLAQTRFLLVNTQSVVQQICVKILLRIKVFWGFGDKINIQRFQNVGYFFQLNPHFYFVDDQFKVAILVGLDVLQQQGLQMRVVLVVGDLGKRKESFFKIDHGQEHLPIWVDEHSEVNGEGVKILVGHSMELNKCKSNKNW